MLDNREETMKNCRIDSNLINKMNEKDLLFTLSNCEANCPKYYYCDYVALMDDKLKELEETEQCEQSKK